MTLQNQGPTPADLESHRSRARKHEPLKNNTIPGRGNQAPASTGSERTVLAALLHQPDFKPDLRAADFYHENHRLIYGAIRDLRDSGQPADLVSATDALMPEMEKIGGPAYLAGLTDEIVLDPAGHARKVAELSRRRDLIRQGEALKAAADAGDQAAMAEIIEVITSKKTSRRLAVVAVDVADFLQRQFPPRQKLLAPWLPSQGIAMVYAYRGIGKTHFALAVAYAVASAGMFLGYTAPAPVGVLYLDGEMPGPVMQERLSAIIASDPRDNPEMAPLRIVTPDLQPEGMPRIDTPEGQAAIEAILTPEIKLIVVDNISTFTTAKENEGDGWTPVQSWVLRQRAAGRSVLLVHHAGKGGAQRGTSRREDVLDTVISLKRPVDYEPHLGAVFEIHFEKARGLFGEDVTPVEASLTTDDRGRMIWTTRSVEAGTFDRVVALLNEGLTQKEIAVELEINKSSVSRHAKKAENQGLVTVKKNRVERKRVSDTLDELVPVA